MVRLRLHRRFALGVYKPADLEGINALPRLWEASNWTPFQQLKAFRESDISVKLTRRSGIPTEFCTG